MMVDVVDGGWCSGWWLVKWMVVGVVDGGCCSGWWLVWWMVVGVVEVVGVVDDGW